MGEDTLCGQVRHNLNYQHLWTEFEEIELNLDGSDKIRLVKALPPAKLHPDDDKKTTEYVLPVSTHAKWSIHKWDQIFSGIAEAERLDHPPRRVIMAMVTNDSTVVYYFVNHGLIKPRKN